MRLGKLDSALAEILQAAYSQTAFHLGSNNCKDPADIKTISPKQVVTMVHFMTISGHFLANPFNIFHKTEDPLVILN